MNKRIMFADAGATGSDPEDGVGAESWVNGRQNSTGYRIGDDNQRGPLPSGPGAGQTLVASFEGGAGYFLMSSADGRTYLYRMNAPSMDEGLRSTGAISAIPSATHAAAAAVADRALVNAINRNEEVRTAELIRSINDRNAARRGEKR